MRATLPALPLGLLLLAAAQPSAAQTTDSTLQLAVEEAPGPPIDFTANRLEYDDTTEIVLATGDVLVERDGARLTADEVEWNRKTGMVEARGNVRVVDANGNAAYGERVELSETLKDGTIDAFLLILQSGGRLAGRSGKRVDEVSTLERGVYSPCNITDNKGCPQTPVWQIKASRVVHDPERQRIRYSDARLEILGVPLLYSPTLTHPDRSGVNASGLLIPTIRIDRSLGFVLEQPYYWSIAAERDLTVTPILYTEVNPALMLDYRQLTPQGPFQLGGIGTYSSREDNGVNEEGRGAFWSNGRFQHSPFWRSTFGVRLASDDTFLRRYDISRDDTLRNFYALERQDRDTYLSIDSWAFQGLRSTDRQGQTPIVLPRIDFRWTPDERLAGGLLSLRANTAAITRTAGEDMQRLSLDGRWQWRGLAGGGQRLTATALMRGDVVHMTDQNAAFLPVYSGEDGWEARIFPAAAVELDWPLAGPALGGTQQFNPRLQLVASPTGLNDGFANEDSRSFELDTYNLFDINRFAGFDRWQGGARLTYGGQWSLDRPRWRVEAELGQSYSFNDIPADFTIGNSGIAGNFSDFVGRFTLRFGRKFDYTHRFRLDKNDLNVRRNEIDVTFGGRQTYGTVGYVKFNRDSAIEEFGDREELRIGGRLAFARYWSVFGSAIVDLTSRGEDPLNLSDGFEPVRHRIGIAYQDECFGFGVTWRRDYTEDRDFESGSTILFSINFKTLGSPVSEGSARPRY